MFAITEMLAILILSLGSMIFAALKSILLFIFHLSNHPLIHCKLYKHNISNSAKELKAITRTFLKNFVDKLYHGGI